MDYIIYSTLGLGLFINFISIIGLVRFPDIYTKLHAATKTTTFAAFLIVISVILKSALYFEETSVTIIIHSFIAMLVILFTNPVSAHAIAHAAYMSGVKPFGAEIDEFKAVKREEAGL